jgi:rod shape-determining protein MreD
VRSLLGTLLALGAALGFQAGVGRIWPEGHRYVEAMIVPVVWHAIARSQRAGMLVGCAAGLLHDAWFEGLFGAYGFKWTLLGWALGGTSSRLDLNNPAGRVAAGAVAWLADSLLDPVLRRMVDLKPLVRSPHEILIQAVVVGLLTAVAGSIVDRREGGRPAHRRPR